ncbi:MAG: hypothetical protein ACFFDH_23915 [Promethearchaeota archaeon]
MPDISYILNNEYYLVYIAGIYAVFSGLIDIGVDLKIFKGNK